MCRHIYINAARDDLGSMNSGKYDLNSPLKLRSKLPHSECGRRDSFIWSSSSKTYTVAGQQYTPIFCPTMPLSFCGIPPQIFAEKRNLGVLLYRHTTFSFVNTQLSAEIHAPFVVFFF
jgi:hypothetical protein